MPRSENSILPRGDFLNCRPGKPLRSTAGFESCSETAGWKASRYRKCGGAKRLAAIRQACRDPKTHPECGTKCTARPTVMQTLTLLDTRSWSGPMRQKAIHCRLSLWTGDPANTAASDVVKYFPAPERSPNPAEPHLPL